MLSYWHMPMTCLSKVLVVKEGWGNIVLLLVRCPLDGVNGDWNFGPLKWLSRSRSVSRWAYLSCELWGWWCIYTDDPESCPAKLAIDGKPPLKVSRAGFGRSYWVSLWALILFVHVLLFASAGAKSSRRMCEEEAGRCQLSYRVSWW